MTGDSLDDLDTNIEAGMEQEDEDTSNDVVRQPDVLAEVKLCSKICESPFYYACGMAFTFT